MQLIRGVHFNCSRFFPDICMGKHCHCACCTGGVDSVDLETRRGAFIITWQGEGTEGNRQVTQLITPCQLTVLSHTQ